MNNRAVLYFDEGKRSKSVNFVDRITPRLIVSVSDIEKKYLRLHIENRKRIRELLGITDADEAQLLGADPKYAGLGSALEYNRKLEDGALKNSEILSDQHKQQNLDGDGAVFNGYFEEFKFEIIREVMLLMCNDTNLTDDESAQMSENIDGFWGYQDIDTLTTFFRKFRYQIQPKP